MGDPFDDLKWEVTAKYAHIEGAVLDVGCGRQPFPQSTCRIDSLELDGVDTLDLECDKFPYKSQMFDFVWCRHVLEDLHYPKNALDEMNRVGKAGYIETPHPMHEATRGIEIIARHNRWRGHSHHKWLVWVESDVLNFVPKTVLFEYMKHRFEPKFSHEMCKAHTAFEWSGWLNYKIHKFNPENVKEYLDTIERALSSPM